MIVGLIEVNDAGLLEQGNILSSSVCSPSDHTVIWGIRDLMNQLFVDFDYLVSPPIRS